MEPGDAIRALEAWGSARDWVGTDPYEGLNATRFVAPFMRTSFSRRVLVQLVKRSPLDLRPLVGIDKRPNAAALSWVLSAYSLGGFLEEEEELARLHAMARRLADMRLDTYEEPCWSYHFDLETRVFFYPKTGPNTIATSFAGMAMLDAFERTGERRYLELAEGAGEFFLRHVPQTEAPGGAYFGYLVGDRSPVHNSNVLVCALLARVSRHVDRPDFRDAARAGAGYALEHQQEDGSWWYGERPNLHWVDGFHTGYVLDSLMACADAGIDDALEPAIRRGLDYYERELFLPDGTAKYYPNRVHPIDAQCVSQGIQTFAIASRRDPKYAETARRVYDFAVTRMRKRDGSYIFARHRFHANRTPHVRWVAAPMLLGFAHLLRCERATA